MRRSAKDGRETEDRQASVARGRSAAAMSTSRRLPIARSYNVSQATISRLTARPSIEIPVLSLSEPWGIIEFAILSIAAVIVALKEYGEKLPELITIRVPPFFKRRFWAAPYLWRL
jgi:hypothetical protein